MAIAYDNSATGTFTATTTPSTLATYTMSASAGGVLLVAIFGTNSNWPSNIGVFANGTTMSVLGSNPAANMPYEYYVLGAPPTGSITITITTGSGTAAGAYTIYSYTGASPSQPDAHADKVVSLAGVPGQPVSQSITTVQNNSLVWGAAGAFETEYNTPIVGFSNNQLLSNAPYPFGVAYLAGDNGVTTTGGTSVTQSYNTQTSYGSTISALVTVSIAPLVTKTFTLADTQVTDDGIRFSNGLSFFIRDNQHFNDTFKQIQHVIVNLFDTVTTIDNLPFFFNTKWIHRARHSAAFSKASKSVTTWTKTAANSASWTKSNKNL